MNAHITANSYAVKTFGIRGGVVTVSVDGDNIVVTATRESEYFGKEVATYTFNSVGNLTNKTVQRGDNAPYQAAYDKELTLNEIIYFLKHGSIPMQKDLDNFSW